VTLGGHQVKPFALLLALKNGEIKSEDWAKQCVELGIAGLDLGAVVPSANDGAEPNREV
jgi:hypothetical protein